MSNKKNDRLETTIIQEIASMKTDIAWINRILFLILALAIGNLFISLSGP
jgi:hypothetical protein